MVGFTSYFLVFCKWQKVNAGNCVKGTWDDTVEIAPVIKSSGTPDNPVYETGTSLIAWKRRPLAPDANKYYNFTILAAQLNEPEDGVAPTDSRLIT